jgi:hypothetical protein
MDQVEREKVAHRIRSLLTKTVANGCTEEEAIAAAQKAREMMDHYRLTQIDLDIKAEPVADLVFDRQMTTQMAPADYCMEGIRKYCGVRMWFTTRSVDGQVRRQARIFGLQSDAEMARYLYEMIEGVIEVVHREWAARTLVSGRAYASYNRRAVSAYRVGMAARINERLIAMAAVLDNTAKTGSGTALVVVKNAVVDEAFAKLGLRFSGRHVRGMSARDADAYYAGQAAGDKVNLDRPVTTGPAAKRLR